MELFLLLSLLLLHHQPAPLPYSHKHLLLALFLGDGSLQQLHGLHLAVDGRDVDRGLPRRVQGPRVCALLEEEVDDFEPPVATGSFQSTEIKRVSELFVEDLQRRNERKKGKE